MPPVAPKLGLQPSILDRLIDPESAGTAIMSGYTVDRMYQAVLRDLEDLLNTRQVSRDIPAGYPETKDSIAAYGLPDLTSVNAATDQTRAEIARSIEAVVRRYEPRLKAVKVSILDQAENAVRGSVRFRVDAKLCVDPAPEVAFDTVLEMSSGKYSVTTAGG